MTLELVRSSVKRPVVRYLAIGGVVLLALLGVVIARSGRRDASASELGYSGWPLLTPEPVRVSQEVFSLCDSPREQVARGPHFVPAIKVYANPTADRALRAGSSVPMPIGAVIVKEKWREGEKQPVAYAAMVKRQQGYDARNGDWEYVYVDLTNVQGARRGKLETCISCHRSAAPRDYLFLTYGNVGNPAR